MNILVVYTCVYIYYTYTIHSVPLPVPAYALKRGDIASQASAVPCPSANTPGNV